MSFVQIANASIDVVKRVTRRLEQDVIRVAYVAIEDTTLPMTGKIGNRQFDEREWHCAD